MNDLCRIITKGFFTEDFSDVFLQPVANIWVRIGTHTKDSMHWYGPTLETIERIPFEALSYFAGVVPLPMASARLPVHHGILAWCTFGLQTKTIRFEYCRSWSVAHGISALLAWSSGIDSRGWDFRNHLQSFVVACGRWGMSTSRMTPTPPQPGSGILNINVGVLGHVDSGKTSLGEYRIN